MKILVLGSGAREHALVWKVAQSPMVSTVYAYPGNSGIEKTAVVPKLENDSIGTILNFALNEKIDFTVVGPENYLADGIVDAFAKHGLKIFGADSKSVMLESSKSFAKDFMKKHTIPTAAYFTFDNKLDGEKIIKSMPYPVVLKADGLAAGKGVVIAENYETASKTIDEMLGGKFGKSGSKIVAEQFLKGEELSLLIFSDGKTYMPLAFSQDHKATFDGDKGPNTGGMGAYTPVSFVDDNLRQRINKEIVKPVFDALKKENIVYKGILYIGLMIVNAKPYVLEFNARFGDPETEPLMTAMESDIMPYFLACVDESLENMPPIKWHQGYAATVVIASEGYPENYEKGKIISGLDNISDSVVFHAGTKKDIDGNTVTSGGRVLMVTAKADTLENCMNKIYSDIEKIYFDGAFCRKDIGYREINR